MPDVSAVSICSNALLILGDRPIASFDEDNDRTRLVSNLYAEKRDAVLRAHPWNCAIKRVVLSPNVDAPAFEWAYAFALPGDWLRTLSVGIDGDQDDYVLEGREILMDKNVCRLRYIFRNEVEATWDALLVDAMTEVMIATLAYAVTKSTTQQANAQDIVRQVLKGARAVDGQEGTTETLGNFPLLANRIR
jgi:hypothetical protein